MNVTRNGECAGTEVHCRDRLARHPELVDDVTHALHVFKEELAWVVEIDVRLRCAVDHKRVGAGHPAVGSDHGLKTAVGERARRRVGHSTTFAHVAVR